MRHEPHLRARQNRVSVCLTKPLFLSEILYPSGPGPEGGPHFGELPDAVRDAYLAPRHRKILFHAMQGGKRVIRNLLAHEKHDATSR